MTTPTHVWPSQLKASGITDRSTANCSSSIVVFHSYRSVIYKVSSRGAVFRHVEKSTPMELPLYLYSTEIGTEDGFVCSVWFMHCVSTGERTLSTQRKCVNRHCSQAGEARPPPGTVPVNNPEILTHLETKSSNSCLWHLFCDCQDIVARL